MLDMLQVGSGFVTEQPLSTAPRQQEYSILETFPVPWEQLRSAGPSHCLTEVVCCPGSHNAQCSKDSIAPLAFGRTRSKAEDHLPALHTSVRIRLSFGPDRSLTGSE